ncbi:MAG: hypothetical protein AB8G11_25625 [Saprospiraceae bacterium]
MSNSKRIQKILFSPIFIVLTILLTLHQIIQKILLINFPFIDAYLDDFLAMPFVLSIFLMEQFFWNRRTSNLTIFEIVIFTTIFSIFFEEIVPKLNMNYTKDLWDYLAYGLGSCFFYLTINQLISKKT